MKRVRGEQRREGDRKFRLSLAVSSLLVALLLLSGIYFAGRSGTRSDVYSNDFNVYYFASREILAGREPYQAALTPSTPYLYPPLFAELLLPLAVLPLPVAAYIWFLISAISLLVAAIAAATLAQSKVEQQNGESRIRLGSLLSPSRETILIAFCSILVLGRFALDNFDYGQVNTVVAALSIAHVLLFLLGKRIASAAILALAVSIKLTPLVFVIYHLARRRFAFALGALSLLVAVTLFSFLPFDTQAPDALRSFVGRTVLNEQGFDLAYSGNQSLRGFLARISQEPQHGEPDRTGGSFLAASLGLMALAVFVASIARSELEAVAPFFCCLVLLSPLAWKAHFIILIAPIALLITAVLSLSRGWRTYSVAASIILVTILFNLTSPKVIGLRAAEWADQHSLVSAASLVLFLSTATLAVLSRVRRDDNRIARLLI